LALTFLSACGKEDDPTLEIVYDPCQALVIAPAPDTTDAERARIVEATRMWNELAKTQLAVAGRDEVPPDPHVPINFESAALAFFGVYDDESGCVSINRDITDEREQAITVAHELGHAFGLLHVEKRASVMNKANLKTLPNAGDLAALTAVWGACEPSAP
jgi:hypothetical protein